MKKISRRACLRRSIAAAAGAAVAGGVRASVWGRPIGANGDVRLAFFGLQRRGPQLLEAFRRVGGVRIVGLCDADRAFVDRAAAKCKARGESVTGCVDFRRILDDKNVDAVVIAAPNHWHALMTVWACQAGKDVYVEKPVSHTIREGRQMIAAARKHERIVQAGTQNRSDVGLIEAVAWLKAGNLGKVVLARGFDLPARASIGKVDGPQPIPGTVDYNLFQGPAPLVPLMRRRLHYDWHFVWPTGDGDCGNRGVHTFDTIRWFLGDPPLPGRAVSVGGRFGFDDDAATPNTQVTVFTGPPVPIVWELLTLPKGRAQRRPGRFGNIRSNMVIEYEGGCFAGSRGGGRALDRDGKVVKRFQGDSGRTHQANFIRAVGSRKADQLRAEIRQGHLSTSLCHLANISWRIGRRQPADAIRRAVKDSRHLAEAFARQLAHLRANHVDLAATPLTLGPELTIDKKRECTTGEFRDWANMYLTRTYRRPFVMPENV